MVTKPVVSAVCEAVAYLTTIPLVVAVHNDDMNVAVVAVLVGGVAHGVSVGTKYRPRRRVESRRGTGAQWTATNPTLPEGASGFETDTGLMPPPPTLQERVAALDVLLASVGVHPPEFWSPTRSALSGSTTHRPGLPSRNA